MMSLTGKKILITRAVNQAGEFAAAIRRLGGEPLFCPTIEIHPPESWKECDRCLKGIGEYDGLLFTSANAVKFFFMRVATLKISINGLRKKNTYAVGEKTKREVEKHSLSTVTIPEKFTGHELVGSLKASEMHGKRFLFPRGDLSGEVLVKKLHSMGARVDAVTIYQTKKPRPENVAQIGDLLSNRKIHIITFTSPSTVRNFISLFSPAIIEPLHQFTTIGVIGPVTARAAEQCGLKPDIVAKESTIESLAVALAEYCSTKPNIRIS